LGTTLTIKNAIHEKIKIRFNLEIGCYHFAQNLRHPLLYSIVSFPIVVCGRDTWSVTLREKHSLRMFENMVLSKVYESQGNYLTGE